MERRSMKTTSSARKPPRRPVSIVCSRSKRNGNCEVDSGVVDDVEIAPPDPRSSKSEVAVYCLLREIDERKLILLISGHPSARSTALTLQALRQQMSVATLDEYVSESLDWIINNDILMLKMKKNSLFCRVLQADGVDSREQMSRLINTMASYPSGRNYFIAHQKIFLPCLIAVLRGKRLPSTTHDQLIACVQKMSIRSSCQKELITSGMLEWAVNHLDQKLNNYAFEYLSAMIVNLSTNSLSQSLMTRLADSIANSISGLISRMSHGQSCSLYNNLLLASLSCTRIRLRSKDTKLLESIRSRVETRKSCPLCNLHIPYLLAIIYQDVEYNRVPQTPTENDLDKAGNSCEREIESLDPLRPSTNELSGARLLMRKAYKDHSADIPNTPVPGQVPYCKTKSSSAPIETRAGTSNSHRRNEPRIGTATSQHTFVIETERRRPLMVNIGLTEGALEYKKSIDDKEKKKEEEEKKRRKEKEEKDKERQKALRHIQLTSRKAPSLLRKELSESSSPLEEKIEKLMMTNRKSPSSKLTLAKKAASLSHHSIVDTQYQQPNKFIEKNNNNTSSTETVVLSTNHFSAENEETDDYSAIFGSRPKVARTPDQQSKSFF